MIVPGRRYGLTISDSRNLVQIGSGGRGTDYPAASNRFDVKFSCDSYRPANPLNNNDAESATGESRPRPTVRASSG